MIGSALLADPGGRRCGPLVAGALAGATAGALVVTMVLSRARRPAATSTLAGASRAHLDDEIRRRVESELSRRAPSRADLTVEVVGGVVTLRGEVAERADADRIVAVLGEVAGVVEVQGLLQVLGNPRPASPVAVPRS